MIKASSGSLGSRGSTGLRWFKGVGVPKKDAMTIIGPLGTPNPKHFRINDAKVLPTNPRP